MALLCCQRLVVAVAHIVGDGFIQALLGTVPCLPGNRLQPRHTGLEQCLTFRVDGVAFFGANHKRTNSIAAYAALIRERLPINQLHQTQKLIRLALVWCS